MAEMALGDAHTMSIFPGSQKLVQIGGGQLLGVFLQHAKKLEASLQEGSIGGELSGHASAVLIHDLLEAEHEHLGFDEVRVDVGIAGHSSKLLEASHRSQHLRFLLFDHCIGNLRSYIVVKDVCDSALGGNAAFSMRTGGELVARSAGTVASGEEALNGRHMVVQTDRLPLLLVLCGHYIGGTAYPSAGSAGVRTDEVRLGSSDFRGLLFGLDVHTGPEERLADGHIQEVFPSFVLELLHLLLEGLRIVFVLGGQVGDGLFRSHVDRALACENIFHTQPVTKVGGDGLAQAVRSPLRKLIGAGYHVLFTHCVGCAGLEQEEPSADRAVTIFKTNRDEAHFLAGHFCAGHNGEICGGAGIPRRIPGAAEAFTDGPGTEYVYCAAHQSDGCFGFEYVKLVFTYAEAYAADAFVAVHKGLGDENALIQPILEAGFVHGVLCGFGHEHFIGLTVDHDLPTAFMHVLAGVVFPNGEAPFLEKMDGRVNVTSDIVHQVFTGYAHEILTNVLHVVFQRIFAGCVADVLVDGGKTHCNSAGTVHSGFVNHGHAEAMLLRPICCFKGGATGRHTTTDDEEISIDYYGFKIRHIITSFRLLLQGRHFFEIFSPCGSCGSRLRTKHVALDVVRTGLIAGQRIGFAFCGCPDGELEALYRAVTELDSPHDVFGAA